MPLHAIDYVPYELLELDVLAKTHVVIDPEAAELLVSATADTLLNYFYFLMVK